MPRQSKRGSRGPRAAVTARGAWHRGAPPLFCVGALALLAFRLWRLDLAPFLLDEPKLQLLAVEQLRTGRWAAHRLQGTQGVVYGPVSVWFYAAMQRFAGPRSAVAIGALCTVLTIAHAALARLLKGGPVLFATVLAFVASSPYLFFWSRMAWDNPLVNAAAATTVAALALVPARGWRGIVLAPSSEQRWELTSWSCLSRHWPLPRTPGSCGPGREPPPSPPR